jgi:hypothetical protein
MQRKKASNGLPIPVLDSSFRLYLLGNPYFLFSIFVLVCDRDLGSSGCFVAETTFYSHPQSEASFSSYCLREVKAFSWCDFPITLPYYFVLFKFVFSGPSCIEKHGLGFVRTAERLRNRDSRYNAERDTKN